MIIDTTFDFYTDANGGDPDLTSPTLRSYHEFLWSKPLPNGELLDLSKKGGYYLYHNSDLGEFKLGSDAITHSYKHQKRKQWLIQQVPEHEIDELFKIGSTIGARTIFPNKKVNNKFTINQSRGVNSLIDDRWDLTLECIRLFYLGQSSPLYDTFLRYKNFFDLFESFEGYIDFFLLNDLVDENKNIKFYLPFDHFKSRPTLLGVEDYLSYKAGVVCFVKSRNKRIEGYMKNE